MAGPIWSDWERPQKATEAVQLYRQGVRVDHIAERLGCSERCVYRMLKRHDSIERRSPKRTPAEMAAVRREILRLGRAGLPINVIRRKVRRTWCQVRAVLDAAGVTVPRGRSGWQQQQATLDFRNRARA